jgi:hypothetical protein
MNTITISIAESNYELTMFKSEELESQVFLILSILESQLLNDKINEDLIINVANGFRNSEMYESDMDKNTSLVYCVETDINSSLLEKKKVEIEDDPYYFKKYVFSYSNADSEKFEQLCKQFGKRPLDFIQSYILNTDNFSAFKKNYKKETAYKMISDLVIKLPMIPLSFKEYKEIKTVAEYMEEIKKCSKDEIIQLDQIIDDIANIDLSETDELLGAIFKVWPLEDEGEADE